MMNKGKELYGKHQEVVSYIFFGGCTTLINWVAYSLFTLLLGTGMVSITVSNVSAWAISVIFAFVTNKLWVFNSKSWERATVWFEGVSFVSARLATGLFELVSVPGLVAIGLNQKIMGIEGMVSKVVVGVVVIVLNYVFSKIWIFKSKAE